jgi:hypothetical protein
MIGSALVGTFMGVFMAYGLVGPFATKVKAVVEEDAPFPQADPRSAGGETCIAIRRTSASKSGRQKHAPP